MCSSFVHPVTITSSRYSATYGMPETRLSTNFWKIAGAGAAPNDNRVPKQSVVYDKQFIGGIIELYF